MFAFYDLWDVRTEKNCPPLVLDSDRKKLSIPLLQYDTLRITTDIFTLHLNTFTPSCHMIDWPPGCHFPSYLSQRCVNVPSRLKTLGSIKSIHLQGFSFSSSESPDLQGVLCCSQVTSTSR